MQRIPEPELMNEPLQAHAYAQADFSEAHDRFVALFAEKFPKLPLTGTALDLGCGPADITRRFARAYPAWRLHGIDGARNMLSLGRAANVEAKLDTRIELFEAQLPDTAAIPLRAYDAVVSNSLLHHLHDPRVLWRTMRQYAKSGAPVFIMDLLRPASSAVARELVARYAANEPIVLRADFLASLHAAFTHEEVRAQLVDADLTALQTEVVSDRHLIVYGYML